MTTPLFLGHAPQTNESDERYTPQWIFDGLGLVFDLDPASPGQGAGDCVPATTKITKATNGLAVDWFGLVWLNPPFSASTEWADKFVAHGNGVFLGPVANSRWTHDLMSAANLIWLCRDFAFTHPTHAGRRSSMPLFMAAMGVLGTQGLRRLATKTSHQGTLVRADWRGSRAEQKPEQ